MTIFCPDIAAFLDTLQGLVQRGLTFKAYHSTLTIELTGGY